MESRARGITLLGILSTASLVLVASFALKDGSKSSLYCVPKASPFFISTLNPGVPRAKCFRSQQGFFTEVFEDYPTSTEEILFLNGHVLPGIIESHGHILQYGEMLESVSLYGAQSIDDVRTRIKDFLKSHKGEGYGTHSDKWVRGVGWDQAHFGGVMPTAVRPVLFDLEPH